MSTREVNRAAAAACLVAFAFGMAVAAPAQKREFATFDGKRYMVVSAYDALKEHGVTAEASDGARMHYVARIPYGRVCFSFRPTRLEINKKLRFRVLEDPSRGGCYLDSEMAQRYLKEIGKGDEEPKRYSEDRAVYLLSYETVKVYVQARRATNRALARTVKGGTLYRWWLVHFELVRRQPRREPEKPDPGRAPTPREKRRREWRKKPG